MDLDRHLLLGQSYDPRAQARNCAQIPTLAAVMISIAPARKATFPPRPRRWSGGRDLNPRQPAWKAGALPLSYPRPVDAPAKALMPSDPNHRGGDGSKYTGNRGSLVELAARCAVSATAVAAVIEDQMAPAGKAHPATEGRHAVPHSPLPRLAALEPPRAENSGPPQKVRR